MFDVGVFGNRLKMLRINRGTSRAEMSKKTGVPISSIGNYERGDKIPGADTLRLLCDFYQVSADYLLGCSDEITGLQWPSAVPVGAVDAVDEIKRTVELLISNVYHTAFGLNTLKWYTEIIKMLPEIDAFAKGKLVDLQHDYPNFRQFGTEMQMQFDGVPLLMALTTGDENATAFAKRLTTTISEIEKKISTTSDDINDILLSRVIEAIRGVALENIEHRSSMPKASEDQLRRYDQGRLDAQKIINSAKEQSHNE